MHTHVSIVVFIYIYIIVVVYIYMFTVVLRSHHSTYSTYARVCVCTCVGLTRLEPHTLEIPLIGTMGMTTTGRCAKGRPERCEGTAEGVGTLGEVLQPQPANQPP